MMPSSGNPATIILARHGETTGNHQQIILGQRDYPLTIDGMATIRKLATILPKNHSGRIISSPLGRALTSARIFADQTGWPIQVLDGLAELSCGQWEGKFRKTVILDRRYLRSTWEEAPPDGESYRDAEARVMTAIYLIHTMLDHDPILVVGHAAVNRVFIKRWMGLSPEQAMNILFCHDELYVLQSGNMGRMSIDRAKPSSWAEPDHEP